MKVSKKALAVAAVAGAAATALVATPALATSDSCSVTGLHTSCTTYYIPSNYVSHFIDWRVCGATYFGVSFKVRDYQNGNVVSSGTVGPLNCLSGRVGGLYSSYRLELSGTALGAAGTIDNV
jgi:hypothetical protein